MTENLNITIIQSDLHWQEKDANLAMFEEKIWDIGEPSDLIILPEMFNTGFTMETGRFKEVINGKTFKWMKQQAAQAKAVIAGSFIVSENKKYYNRLIWMQPDGQFLFYDKKHLFQMAGEGEHFSSGQKKMIASLKGWKIAPLVCYDLRFPVWSRNCYDRNTDKLDYDLLIYVANWPASRINAWDTLLQARAIENSSYVVGVNRVGKDGNDVRYNGHSTLINPKGRRLFYNEDKEVTITISLEAEKLLEYRKKFPSHADQDNFTIH